MDQLQTRLEALEQQMCTVNRRLRWWRGLAGGLLALAVLTWALPLGTAQDAQHDDKKGLEQRVAALEKLLKHFTREGNEVFITGANLHIVNGLGRTDCGTEEEPIPDCPNGLGNLIVGYNELREVDNARTGSHNVVVGRFHNFSRFGGLVVGEFNTISGNFAAVGGGGGNTASGFAAAVSGGLANTARGDFAAVSGGGIDPGVEEGCGNTASGFAASVTGGECNTASGDFSWVSGGTTNTARGKRSTVSGGGLNGADGPGSSVSGGGFNTASGELSSVSGGQENRADGDRSSVHGGHTNTARGTWSAVSGGRNMTQATEFGWSAGSEADEIVVGNFRSP
jgi:hypothetical protein